MTAPRRRPGAITQATENWRAAQSALATAQRRHLTITLLAARRPTAANLAAMEELNELMSDALAAEGSARQVFMSVVRSRMDAAADPGRVQGLPR